LIAIFEHLVNGLIAIAIALYYQRFQLPRKTLNVVRVFKMAGGNDAILRGQILVRVLAVLEQARTSASLI
jgi:hypothetical protein